MTNEEAIDILYERKNTMEYVTDYDDLAFDMAIKALEQEPKKGHWIPMEISSGRDSWKCSECGRRARGKLENLPYCHCGAKMESEG